MQYHQQSPPSLCLAIVRENGTDVVLFDASGKPRTFKYKGNPGKLCFSSHGAVGADELLTPCFDEDGMHGVPDESCFCGIDTPHIHAHKHDSVKCTEEPEESACSSKKKKQTEADVGYLASVTLHPSDNDEAMPQFEVSETHPQECNSEVISQHLTDHGFTRDKLGRRVTKIQHGDHVDHLVHNETTGDLHLEHDCNNCGDDDLHGTFDLMGKRKLEGDVQLHFFQSSAKPFSIRDAFGLESLSHVFDTTSDCVNVIRPSIKHKQNCCLDPTCKASLREKTASERIDDCCASGSHDHAHGHAPAKKDDCYASGSPAHARHHAPAKKDDCCSGGICSTTKTVHLGIPEPPEGKEVRSTFHCAGICCASEIPLISTVLEPKDGVSNVVINVPVKQVMVDHDPSLISAEDINKILNAGGFGSTLKCDGAATTDNTGRSHFFVEKICCASEIPAIKKILEPKAGVSKVSINVTAKMVYVDHDTTVVSAQALCDALNVDRFGAHLKRDGAPTRSNTVGRSHFFVEKICCASEIPAINAILEPIHGVSKVSMNVTAKMVYVDHDTAVVSAHFVTPSTRIALVLTSNTMRRKTWELL